jgi:IS5 family transposase
MALVWSVRPARAEADVGGRESLEHETPGSGMGRGSRGFDGALLDRPRNTAISICCKGLESRANSRQWLPYSDPRAT